MADILDLLRAKTPKQQAVLDALRAQGWTVQPGGLPSSVVASHPLNDTEIATPDYVPRDWWPGSAYTSLRSLTILYTLINVDRKLGEVAIIKVYAVFGREHSAPWVSGHEHALTLAKAIDWINERHPAERKAAAS